MEIGSDALGRYLIERIPGLQGKPELEAFRGGYSNLTYLVRFPNRELVLRCAPSGRKAASAHDMAREYRVLKGVHPIFRLCPEPYLYCDEESILGKPFYVMERLKGIVPRKPGFRKLGIGPKPLSRICRNLIDLHAELHAIDYAPTPLASLGHPEGYLRRQVDGWSERYRTARTPNAPRLEGVMRWLSEHMPSDSVRPSLIHNDFKLDNIVLDPANDHAVSGVLDWEMATIGDPLVDLGCSLAYWVQRSDPWYLRVLRSLPTTEPGAWTRDELVRRYAEKTGADVTAMDYYYCFGLFRLAGIAQQIYYRYYHGQSRDKRFRKLIFAVYALESTAKRVIKKSRI